MIDTKVCSSCSLELPLSSFALRERSPDGLRAQCRGCVNNRRREQRKVSQKKLQRPKEQKQRPLTHKEKADEHFGTPKQYSNVTWEEIKHLPYRKQKMYHLNPQEQFKKDYEWMVECFARGDAFQKRLEAERLR